MCASVSNARSAFSRPARPPVLRSFASEPAGSIENCVLASQPVRPMASQPCEPPRFVRPNSIPNWLHQPLMADAWRRRAGSTRPRKSREMADRARRAPVDARNRPAAKRTWGMSAWCQRAFLLPCARRHFPTLGRCRKADLTTVGFIMRSSSGSGRRHRDCHAVALGVGAARAEAVVDPDAVQGGEGIALGRALHIVAHRR
jgi:hypothetical protein